MPVPQWLKLYFDTLTKWDRKEITAYLDNRHSKENWFASEDLDNFGKNNESKPPEMRLDAFPVAFKVWNKDQVFTLSFKDKASMKETHYFVVTIKDQTVMLLAVPFIERQSFDPHPVKLWTGTGTQRVNIVTEKQPWKDTVTGSDSRRYVKTSVAFYTNRIHSIYEEYLTDAALLCELLGDEPIDQYLDPYVDEKLPSCKDADLEVVITNDAIEAEMKRIAEADPRARINVDNIILELKRRAAAKIQDQPTDSKSKEASFM